MSYTNQSQLKKAFDLCVESSFNQEQIQIESIKEGINRRDFMQRARSYYKYCATNQEQSQYNMAHKAFEEKMHIEFTKLQYEKTADAKYVQIFDKILESNSEKDIFPLFKDLDASYFHTLRISITSYANRKKGQYSREESAKIENRILYFVNRYSEVLRKEDLERRKLAASIVKDELNKEKLTNAINELNKLINSDFILIDQYAKTNGIDLKYLKSCINLVEKNGSETYSLYVNKLKEVEQRNFNLFGTSIKELINMIKTGILVGDDKYRPFDLMDYYTYTKVSFEEVLYVAKSICNSDEIRILKTFTSTNTHNFVFDKVAAIEIKTTILVDGIKKEITDDEKNFAIDYLEANEIPICSKTYSLALVRYANGKLTNVESKTLTKK